MAPVLAVDLHHHHHHHHQQQHLHDTVLRARYDGRDVDHKAVGGHLPLSKRNSTPVGSCLGTPTHLLTKVTSTTPTTTPTPLETSNTHRRLDRSHSEPVKQDGRANNNNNSNSSNNNNNAANSSRYKTELCRPFEENGFCKYGDKCQFAHGQAELRTLSRHPKYKTELCRTFHTIGFCPYGPRCHFIHNAEERRNPSGALVGTSGGGGTGGGGGGGAPTGTTSNTHAPLMRPHALHAFTPLDSTAESPSPPASINGSPTSSTAGSFFDETFSLFGTSLGGGGGCTNLNFLETLPGLSTAAAGSALCGGPGSPGGSAGSRALSELDLLLDGHLLTLPGLDTPPVSPVESLAGDIDSLSLSSSHSVSPVPAASPSMVMAPPHHHHHQQQQLTTNTSSVASALDVSRGLRLPIFEKLCETC